MIQTLSGKMPIPALVGVNFLDWHETPLLIVSKLDEELCPDCLVRFLEYANEYISGFSSDRIIRKKHLIFRYSRNFFLETEIKIRHKK